jgi:probable blue pigment (indigoidine) exporter
VNARRITIAATALAPMAWGSTYLVTTQLLPADRPLSAGLLRALPAGLVLLAVTRVLPRRDWWWRSATLGALNIGAFFPLLFLAAYRLPGGVAAVLGATQPLIVAALTVVALHTRVPLFQVTAAIAGVVGVGLVVLRNTATLDPLGIAGGFAAAAAMAVGTVLTRKWGRPDGVGDLAFTGWQLTAGGLLIAPVALAVEGPLSVPTLSAATGYLYLAMINTALAYVLWFRGVRRLSTVPVSLLGILSPVVASTLGWLVLDERLTWLQLLGMAVALGATTLGQLRLRPSAHGHARQLPDLAPEPSLRNEEAPTGATTAEFPGDSRRSTAADPRGAGQ